MIINNRFEEPYNKFPKDGPLPLLSKPIVISKLSIKFWLYTQYLRNQNILKNNEKFLDEGKNTNNNNNEENNLTEAINLKSENINFEKNRNLIKRPKSNINYGNNKNRKNNIDFNKENDINELNKIIFRLQNELNKQDFIINSQRNEKMKLAKRIHELEIVLKNFC